MEGRKELNPETVPSDLDENQLAQILNVLSPEEIDLFISTSENFTPMVPPLVPPPVYLPFSDVTSSQSFRVSLALDPGQAKKKWIFADNLEPVMALEGDREGADVFVDGRKIIQLKDTYKKTAGKRKHVQPISYSILELLQRDSDWVFSKTGQRIPLDGKVERITAKRFSVNGEPIITKDAFLKRPFVFKDNNQPLSREEKKELVYNESNNSFFYNERLVEIQIKPRKPSARKKARVAATESTSPATYPALPTVPESSHSFIPPIYSQSGNPTLFGNSQSSGNIKSGHQVELGITSFRK